MGWVDPPFREVGPDIERGRLPRVREVLGHIKTNAPGTNDRNPLADFTFASEYVD